MNKSEVISSELLHQSYTRVEHSSGLTIMMCPMAGFSTAYAMFAAKVGSIDTTFKTQREDDFVTVPEGIAHFLEHKMFESEEGDTFAQYAKVGANANAYTSFDRTSYLFSCTDKFRESMEILLRQVTVPYFTQQTVEKEQGIIGQEIQMYDDNPGWRVMFNLLGSLYHNNPVRLDIAGTVKSISKISADLLYRCYNTFYNLSNMVLVVAGNFKEQDVLELADQILKKSDDITIAWKKADEPRRVVSHLAEQSLPVSTPIFMIGFKGPEGDSLTNLRHQIMDEVLQEIICGESSPLYRRMYDSGLINGEFEYEIMAGRDYLTASFEGESRDPQEVYRLLCDEITRLREEGLPRDTFERCKKATYGRYISMYCKPDAVAGVMLMTHFCGMDNMYDLPAEVRAMTIDDLTERLMEDFDPQYSAVSIIKPLK